MGLDMYLSKKTYVKNWDHMTPEERCTVTISGRRSGDIKPERISYIVEEVAYWRKANAIHKWFVDNVQDGVDDCKPHYVELENLQELRDLCLKVLNGEAKAEDALPPQDGFFFGDTDIDEYYMEDLRDTVKVLDEILSEENSGYCEFEYRSSW